MQEEWKSVRWRDRAWIWGAYAVAGWALLWGFTAYHDRHIEHPARDPRAIEMLDGVTWRPDPASQWRDVRVWRAYESDSGGKTAALGSGHLIPGPQWSEDSARIDLALFDQKRDAKTYYVQLAKLALTPAAVLLVIWLLVMGSLSAKPRPPA